MRRALVALAVSAALLSARPSWAQDGNPAVAEALFREGQRLMKDNAIPEACGKFAESMKLDPTTGTLLNLALCHEKQGKLALAWSEMNQAALQSARASNKEREAFARDKIAELEKRLPHARIVIAKSAGVTDLTVDGQPLGSAAWGIPLPVDPGEHVFVFSGGEKRRALNVAFAEGATQEVALASLDDGSSATVGPRDGGSSGPVTSPPAEEPSSGTRRTVGFVVGGVGIAGLAVGTLFGVKALGSKSDVDAGCVDARCTQAGLDAAGDARSAATLSTIGFGVGIVGLAVGTYLVLTSPRAKSSGRVDLTPVLAGPARGLQLGGVF
jgi:hypothetical protein